MRELYGGRCHIHHGKVAKMQKDLHKRGEKCVLVKVVKTGKLGKNLLKPGQIEVFPQIWKWIPYSSPSNVIHLIITLMRTMLLLRRL